MSELCHHDWVGDDECAYCKCEELEERIAELELEKERLEAANRSILSHGVAVGMERAADIAKNMESEYSSVSWNNACLDVWRAIRKEIK